MPALYKKQYDALFGPERYSVTAGSTKSGKTQGALIWQATKVLECKKQGNHWWVAPVYSQAEIAFNRAKNMFRGLCSPNKSSLKLVFANGAIWQFKTGDKPDNLYGEDVYSVVFDEFTRAREEAWYAVRSTVTATEAPVRFIGNAKGRGWGYKLGRAAQQGKENWKYHEINASDAVAAGVLSEVEIMDAEKTLPHDVFRELYYCEPSDSGGNPFGLKRIQECISPLSTKKPIKFGVDLAKKLDYTVVIGVDEDNNVCSFDRWKDTPWNDTIRKIQNIVGKTTCLVDATGVGDPIFESLSGTSSGNYIPYVFTSKSKQMLLENLAVQIQSREIGFPESEITEELEVFEYEISRTGYKYSAPQGLHDDCVIALSLAAYAKQQVLVLESLSKEKDKENDDQIWTTL